MRCLPCARFQYWLDHSSLQSVWFIRRVGAPEVLLQFGDPFFLLWNQCLRELGFIQFLIDTSGTDKIFVLAALHDHSVFDDQNLICGKNRGQTVCDQNTGFAFNDRINCLLNLLFRYGIQCGRGLVKDKDCRIFQQNSRDGDTLLLTT